MKINVGFASSVTPPVGQSWQPAGYPRTFQSQPKLTILLRQTGVKFNGADSPIAKIVPKINEKTPLNLQVSSLSLVPTLRTVYLGLFPTFPEVPYLGFYGPINEIIFNVVHYISLTQLVPYIPCLPFLHQAGLTPLISSSFHFVLFVSPDCVTTPFLTVSCLDTIPILLMLLRPATISN